MKPVLSVHLRAWRANCFIKDSGLVLNEVHVLKVCPLAEAKAALATTRIIERMMQS